MCQKKRKSRNGLHSALEYITPRIIMKRCVAEERKAFRDAQSFFRRRKMLQVPRSVREISLYAKPKCGCLVALFCRADITDDKKIYETRLDIDSTIRHFKYVAARGEWN